MNIHNKQIATAFIKAVYAAAGESYDQSYQKGIQAYNSEIIKTIRQALAVLYYILETMMEYLETKANARWIEQWHNTILCTCRKCDPQYLWKTKGLRELKRSWM